MFRSFFGGNSSTATSETKKNKKKKNDKKKDYANDVPEDAEQTEEEDNNSDNEDDAISTSDGAYSSVSQDAISTKEDTKSQSQDNPLLPEELCEIPTFLHTEVCDKKLIERTRNLLDKKYKKRPESFNPEDYQRMYNDDWTVSRFLLRCRLDPKRSAKLMEQCGKFRQEFKMGTSKLSDFPIEFHKAGGLFGYAPDRVGNQTLYMRVKMHRRVPELSQMMKEFILCWMEQCDKANGGRGTAVIFDLSQSGLQNADLSFLFWLLYSFRSYCPKGLSYIIIYNLPWILNATCKLALSWLSSTNRRRLRFVSGEAIKDFIAPENLPDYMGGTCKINYRQVPPGSQSAEDTAEQHNLTREQSRKIKDLYAKFLKEVDGDYDSNDQAKDEDLGSDHQPASLISSSIIAS